ncbi:helix-turn-helix DNA binding domain protein [Mycobacterium phage Aminay]|uniref:Helix-turn-helix DNA binding domain protein n=1 Tax=Mycobacterium phage Aminay TaxID=2250291 RepID=A0A345KV41_9CAUD|nr:helix-turn-helix DNA binding domain protein [Mycobacterium phage Aminay]AXH46893.1 helix-turn-helix DNA binding domain protein [Mycobacterium phage Aminay]
MARRADQQYASATRDIRDTLADNTHVLDEFTPVLHDGASTDDVCKLLGIEPWTPKHHLKKHADELVAAGYDPDERTWSRQAIIRLALLTRGTNSAEISAAAGFVRVSPRPHRGLGASHVNRCKRLLEIATGAAQHVKEQDPAELWLQLDELSRYELQAVAVALAALVPIDKPGVFDVLTKSAPHQSKQYGGNGAANGLAQLVPAKGNEPIGEIEA